MLTLYGSPKTRSSRVQWLLEELGVPYELKNIDLKTGDSKSPDYLKIHPHGAVPALVDGDKCLIESAALCAYLADKYGKFSPRVDSAERGDYYQWLFYGVATLEPPLMHTARYPEDKRVPAIAEEGKQGFQSCATVLEDHLRTRNYILGKDFTAADCVVGSLLAFAKNLGLTNGYPTIEAYVARIKSRPAFQRMIATPA